MFTYFSETCCNSTIITDVHVVSSPHDHKSFDYEFCTLTSTLSNLNASCIYWIRLSDWMIFEYKTRDGKVNDCKWWSPCFVRVSTFVCQLEYNLYKWWWAGVNWVLGFSCLSSRWEILQLYQDYLVYFVTNARTDIVNNQVIPTGLGYISGNLN